MIKQIVVSDVATYPHKPSEMNNLSQINFVYGPNGSGKTTISNFLSNPTNFPNSCSIEWADNRPIDIYTYNKSFRESHFGEDIPGIFTLGKATKEEIEAIKNKQKEQQNAIQKGIGLEKSLEKIKSELNEELTLFSEWCWQKIKKEFENSFRACLQGALNSKLSFANKVYDEISKTCDGDDVCSIEELRSRAETLYNSSLCGLETIDLIDSLAINEIEGNVVWSKKIVGSSDVDLASLIAQYNSYDWVNQGRNYISKVPGICPFCQHQTIDQLFIEKLEKIFDRQYAEDANLVESLCKTYRQQCFSVLSEVDVLLQKEKANKFSKIDIVKLSELQGLLKSSFDLIQQKMEEKRRELSRCIELKTSSSILTELNNLISSANIEIEAHNRQVENIVHERRRLEKDFWNYIKADNSIYFNQHKNKVENCQKAIRNIESRLQENSQLFQSLDYEIKEANKNVTSVQSSVDEMNKMLRLYGFTNFSIVSAGNNRYQIQRENGELASQTLSEGEITFISFLYFVQLVIGGETAEKAQTNRVVIIDDPISSLDSMILYVVSAIIKTFIADIKKGSFIKQLIILTHNVFFHKEVSFVDGRESETSKYSYWVIVKRDGVSRIYSYNHTNPIKSSYEMLWEDVKNWNRTSASALQNTMRRIYETYFKVLGKMSDSEILQSINDSEDRKICYALIGWINDGSHTIPDDYYIVPSDDERERYLKVFRMIFEKMGHINHYNMMMGIK